jgi:uncharacterized protein YjfI (DUF2170 family)
MHYIIHTTDNLTILVIFLPNKHGNLFISSSTQPQQIIVSTYLDGLS